jgi:Fungal specific transcription factor domain
MPQGREKLFIIVNPRQSQREKELVVSRIRQHVARLSYRDPDAGLPCYQSTGNQHHSMSEESDAPRHELDFNPWQLSTGYRHDPFNCIPGSDEYSSRAALDFLTGYAFTTASVINSAYGVVNLWARYLLPLMAQSEAFFHAVVAIMTATRHYVDRTNHLTEFPDILSHRQRAITKLRSRLSQANALADDAAVLTILFLCVRVPPLPY